MVEAYCERGPCRESHKSMLPFERHHRGHKEQFPPLVSIVSQEARCSAASAVCIDILYTMFTLPP